MCILVFISQFVFFVFICFESPRWLPHTDSSPSLLYQYLSHVWHDEVRNGRCGLDPEGLESWWYSYCRYERQVRNQDQVSLQSVSPGVWLHKETQKCFPLLIVFWANNNFCHCAPIKWKSSMKRPEHRSSDQQNPRCTLESNLLALVCICQGGLILTRKHMFYCDFLWLLVLLELFFFCFCFLVREAKPLRDELSWNWNLNECVEVWLK